MIYVIKTILDHTGKEVASEPLPVTFDYAAGATRFLHRYVAQVYADGRRGYENDRQSWWGCDAGPAATLHRYTLVGPAQEASRGNPPCA
jgi:hypothetical protein